MKKLLSIVLCILITAASLAGCGAQNNNNGTLKIVTTIFPLYDWTKNITDSAGAELSMLVNNGTDLHSFQPTVDDIGSITACDVFIYVGGESDKWVGDALAQQSNPDRIVIDLMDVLQDQVKEEELVEGMEPEEEEEDEAGDEGPEYDEHIWLSLKNAKIACDYIAQRLAEKDSANADTYRKNAEAYTKELEALDSEYKTAVDSAENKTLLFGDRFPFRYMVDDYGLSYYAAFIGCSAESEASFETIAFLSKKVDELGLKYIMTIESSDGSIANTIKNSTKKKDQEILTLDSLQSITAQTADDAGYLDAMRSNLEVLKKALS